ncbi:hypothetical protein HPB51_021889 [Rhipicephalus microplus]|uniref:Uncharacterized protein n=1 Tax=Rhipicephalus microplus TaxID=6941 RepID=A0A9J6EII0_RHIMP|nr:hypothetical protein HPB51_021889 [Rhipicephalus microplus]
MGESALKSHMKSAKHVENMTATAAHSTVRSHFTAVEKQRVEPTPSSSTSSDVSSLCKAHKSVVDAEILWTLKMVTVHYSYKSSAHTGDLFKKMFPDREIAKAFSCSERKSAYVVYHGLRPFFLSCLQRELEQSDGYTDPLLLAKLKFAMGIAMILKLFLTEYQLDKPLVFFLKRDLECLVRKLLARFVKCSVLPASTGVVGMLKMDVADPNNHVSSEKADIGHAAEQVLKAAKLVDWVSMSAILSLGNTQLLQEKKHNLRQFDKHTLGLDEFYLELLKGDLSYMHLWKVIRLLLILNHGQATVERGFGVNRQVSVENLKDISYVSQRIVCDAVSKAGGILNVAIAKELRKSVAAAHNRYRAYLEDTKKQENVKGSFGYLISRVHCLKIGPFCVYVCNTS